MTYRHRSALRACLVLAIPRTAPVPSLRGATCFYAEAQATSDSLDFPRMPLGKDMDRRAAMAAYCATAAKGMAFPQPEHVLWLNALVVNRSKDKAERAHAAMTLGYLEHNKVAVQAPNRDEMRYCRVGPCSFRLCWASRHASTILYIAPCSY